MVSVCVFNSSNESSVPTDIKSFLSFIVQKGKYKTMVDF